MLRRYREESGGTDATLQLHQRARESFGAHACNNMTWPEKLTPNLDEYCNRVNLARNSHGSMSNKHAIDGAVRPGQIVDFHRRAGASSPPTVVLCGGVRARQERAQDLYTSKAFLTMRTHFQSGRTLVDGFGGFGGYGKLTTLNQCVLLFFC
jgi:hypothetical protein